MTQKPRQALIYGLWLLAVWLLYNLGGGWRIDLTTDHRYSIHPSTKRLLRTIPHSIDVEVYLAGDLPVHFQQLQRAAQELFSSLQTPASLCYRFIHLATLEEKEKEEHYKKLASYHLPPTRLYQQSHGQRIEKIVFPSAIIRYQGREAGVLLLQGNQLLDEEQMVRTSMANLEYTVVQAIDQLVHPQQKKIALLRGHNEPHPEQLHGLTQALQKHYGVHTIFSWSPKVNLDLYDALFITQPQQPFTELEKHAIDQYIMRGGRVLFFLDRLQVHMQHLQSGSTFAPLLDTGLDDLLFRYGVRINPDLIEDLQCSVYPVVVGNLGNQPQVKLMPWPFFPLVSNFGEHLITKHMDMVSFQFSSSMDVIPTEGITAPVHIDLDVLRKSPDPQLYRQGPFPIAYLLEGCFPSLYRNRFLPERNSAGRFLEKSKSTKLLVVSSGSVVKNVMHTRQQQPLPWGYDPFLQKKFANEEFVLQALSYWVQADGLIQLKNKEFQSRMIDPVRLTETRLWWQLFHLLGSLIWVVLVGVGWNASYRRIYGKASL